MSTNGFTLIEALISLSLLGILLICCFATQREYQVLSIQAHHFQEQQEQFTQLREIIENYASDARTQPSPAFTVLSRGGIAIAQWRKALPKYMNATLTSSGNHQLKIKLCSAKPTPCLSEKIVV